MEKLVTKGGLEFQVEWAAPSSISEYSKFLAKIHGADIDVIHNTFKNSEQTEELTKIVEVYEGPMVVEKYIGYTQYMGFSVQYDGDIIVTLKKDLGA